MCSSRSGRSVVWSASTCFHVLRSTWPSPFSNASIFSCWSAVSERLLRWKFVKSTSMRRHTFNFPSSKIYLRRRGARAPAARPRRTTAGRRRGAGAVILRRKAGARAGSRRAGARAPPSPRACRSSCPSAASPPARARPRSRRGKRPDSAAARAAFARSRVRARRGARTHRVRDLVDPTHETGDVVPLLRQHLRRAAPAALRHQHDRVGSDPARPAPRISRRGARRSLALTGWLLIWWMCPRRSAVSRSFSDSRSPSSCFDS